MIKPAPSNYLEILRHWATERPDEVAYTFLDSFGDEEHISFGGLYGRSAEIALHLQTRTKAGDRVILLFSPGLDYLCAFFGCMLSGVIAVPAYPPRGQRSLPRLQGIIEDCRPSLALCSEAVAQRISNGKHYPDAFRCIELFVVPETPDSGCGDFAVQLDVDPSTIVMLQYTSGSTGGSKGVVIDHDNLLANQRMIRKSFGHDSNTKIVSWLPPYHDMGLIGCILQPLFLGTRCYLMRPEMFTQKPVMWLAAISRYQATTSGAPNFAYDLCVDKISDEAAAQLDLSTWKVAFNGSETVRAETIDRFSEKFAGSGFRKSSFFPCYGLAEATLLVSGGVPNTVPICRQYCDRVLEQNQAIPYREGVLGRARTLVSCGSAVDQEVEIVNPSNYRRCAPGILGEIWVKGPHVARGYWSSKAGVQTFGAQLEGLGDKKWLRTGDLGFVDQGELFVTSRLKDLIIIRGLNHYPSDLEMTATAAHPALRPGGTAAFSIEDSEVESVVLVHECDYRMDDEADCAAKAIRSAIAEEHGIIVRDVVIVPPGGVPLTSSGKVRRRYCRNLYLGGNLRRLNSGLTDRGAVDGGFSAPMSPTELAISAIWRRMFRIDQVGSQDSFFNLGGDSVQAAQFSCELSEALGIEVSGEYIFENPMLADLAKCLDEQRTQTTLVDLRQELSPVAFEGEFEGYGTGYFPLSSQQRLIWYQQKLNPDSNAYNVPLEIQIKGCLDERVFREALEFVVGCHELLRTTIQEIEGAPYNRVHSELKPMYSFHEGLPPTGTDCDYLHELQRSVASWVFDISRGPLVRAALVKTRENEYHLLLTLHHLISDGRTVSIILQEWFDAYCKLINEGSVIRSLKNTPSYRHFVDVQGVEVASRKHSEDLKWWVDHLSNATMLDLPVERSIESSSGGCRAESFLSLEMTQGLDALAKANGTTPFVVLITALKILLSRVSGQKQVTVGFPASNRRYSEDHEIVGLFVNTLATSSSIDGSRSFVECLHTEAGISRNALFRQSVPIDEIVRMINPMRSGTGNPFFRVFFNFLDFEVCIDSSSGLELELVEEPVWGGKFDVSLYARKVKDGVKLTLLSGPSCLGPSQTPEVLEQFRRILEQVIDNPTVQLREISLITERAVSVLPDRRRVLKVDDTVPLPFRLFEEYAELYPDSDSVIDSEEVWTYGGLNRKANRLAWEFIDRGVKKGDVIAVYANRSRWLPCVLLAIQKSGAAFAILDSCYPAESIRRRLDVARPCLVVNTLPDDSIPEEILAWMGLHIVPCVNGLARLLQEDNREDSIRNAPPPVAVCLSDLAYVAFTSGTTGEPAGIESNHGPLAHFANWYGELFSFSNGKGMPGRRFSMLSGLSHDPLLRDILIPLCTGNVVVIPPSRRFEESGFLKFWMDDSEIEVAHLTPSLWEYIDTSSEQGGVLEHLSYVVFSGEPLRWELCRKLFAIAPSVQVYNGYGATETPQLASIVNVPRDQELKTDCILGIGSGTVNSQLLLVNDAGDLAALGEMAEIFVHSSCLARAYRGSDQIQSRPLISKLSVDGFLSLDVYRTGDYGRYDTDGQVDFVGRIDRQISVNGFRVELKEIENEILSHPFVTSCHVFLGNKHFTGEREGCIHSSFGNIQGVVVAAYTSSPCLLEGSLREFLERRIPLHMMPGSIIGLARLPLSHNGKLDERVIVESINLRMTGEGRFDPRSTTEELIQRICRESAQEQQIDLEASFFQLGFSSIQAIKLAAEIERAFCVKIRLRDILRMRSIRELALWIENQRWLTEGGSGKSLQKNSVIDRETIQL